MTSTCHSMDAHHHRSFVCEVCKLPAPLDDKLKYSARMCIWQESHSHLFLHCRLGRSKVQGRHCGDPFMCNIDPNESVRDGAWAWDKLMISVKYNVDGVLRIGSQLWVLTLHIFNCLKSCGFAACWDGPTMTSRSFGSLTIVSEHSDPSDSQSVSPKKMCSKYVVDVEVHKCLLSEWVCCGFPSKLNAGVTSTAFSLVSPAVCLMGRFIVEAGAESCWSGCASFTKLPLTGNFDNIIESRIV